MKILFALILFCLLSATHANAQNDELRVRQYLQLKHPGLRSPDKVWFFQCKYKPAKNWQFLVACINTVDGKPSTTLLLAERRDTALAFEPFYFPSVESFDHLNIDNSKDKVEELLITTIKDSGNRIDKFSGMYAIKEGAVDTLINFHSFAIKSLKEPWFKYEPGIVTEEENIFQVADNDRDGKVEISNRTHKKKCFKDAGTGAFSFTYDTEFTEYKLQKGKVIKVK